MNKPKNPVQGTYNKWTYKYFPNGNSIPTEIEITPIIDLQKPKELCKYYAFNAKNILALSNKYFYGSHPFDLNDPFDVNKNMLKLDPSIIDTAYHFLFSYFGILSMTISEIDPLMWSHYCSHRGFVVKYTIDKVPTNFLGPFPINYIDNYEPLDHDDPFLQFLIASNIKYKKFWESENEWRFLLLSPVLMKLPKIFQNQLQVKDRSKKSRFFSYKNYFSIKEVILGYKLLLAENNKVKKVKDIGFEIKTNDFLIQKLFHLLLKEKIRTYLVDINPTTYPLFDKKEITINHINRGRFMLSFSKQTKISNS